jgi:MATE family multidrug resistance protein
MDTLCGQAFGARNYAVLGEILQRARLICWTVCLPVALLWWWMEPVLLLLGQEAQLAALAAVNMRIMIPSLFLGEPQLLSAECRHVRTQGGVVAASVKATQ